MSKTNQKTVDTNENVNLKPQDAKKKGVFGNEADGVDSVLNRDIFLHARTDTQMGEYEASLYEYSETLGGDRKYFISSSKVLKDQFSRGSITAAPPYSCRVVKEKNYFCFQEVGA